MSEFSAANVFSRMLRIQLIATLAVAVIAFFVAGSHGSASAGFGGLSVVIGAYLASCVAKRSATKTDASAILVNLLKAEAVKILVIIVLLVITFVFYKQLVPFALIAGLGAAAIFSGAALSKLNV